jgi:hypothetical protein
MRNCLVAAALALLFPMATLGNVVIHEIHFNPEERGQPLEFIELYNCGDTIADLSGWHFDEGIDYAFPNATTLSPGEMLVVAENPKFLTEFYATKALGPWVGKLSNGGENLTLRGADDKKVDTVDYGVGFPWPTAAAGGGASIELIHPELDNDLGGSWRSSMPSTTTPDKTPRVFVDAASREWRYVKGLREPPRDWRSVAFDSSHWTTAQTPIGYDDGDDHTVLNDMFGNYSTVFLRHRFKIADNTPLTRPLSLRVYCDDGAVIWINGKEAGRLRVTDRAPNHRSRTTNNHEAAWETITLLQPARFLRPGNNVLAILAINGTLTSSDFSIDAALVETPRDAIPPRPSPGQPNRSALASPPPQIRQVAHKPALPCSGERVTISAKITDPDGVSKVTLLYQKLLPGRYYPKDDPQYDISWENLPMTFKDGRHSITLPGDWQEHRHLLRYRILAEDNTGSSITVPYDDDAQSNFAYYCYDGAPAWTGADRPGRTPLKTFSATTTNKVPCLHLLARNIDVERSQYSSRYNEAYFNGTLIVGSRVYDHIRFRNRGETTTYMVGKNKWRINFNRTHELAAHTLDGNTVSNKRRWKRLNLNPGTVPYHPEFRGNASLNERLAFRIYKLAGIPSPDTAYTQLRIIDDLSESGEDQYSGDLWGLYMAFEAIDGFMLDNHKEPDNTLIRVKQMGNTVAREPPSPPKLGMDYQSFWRSLYQRQTPEWWNQRVDLERYYSFHAVSLATARIDQKLNHNHFLYRHPVRGWQALPWDTDLCMRPVAYDPDHHRWHPMLKYSLAYEPFRIAYQNRARELLDLLFTKESIGALVDELVKDLGPIDEQASWAELDRFLWNYHPKTTRRHAGTFFRQTIRGQRISDYRSGEDLSFDTDTFAERVQYFKDYLTPVTSRDRSKAYRGWGHRLLDRNARDLASPLTPIIRRAGKTDALTFQCNAFKDMQGKDTSAGLKWRIAGVTPPIYELTPVWESELIKEGTTFTFSEAALVPGQAYRVRARYFDNTGRASHWSPPIEIMATTPAVTADLVITEIMYHPIDGAPEFIELTNVGTKPIELGPFKFTKGIESDLGRLASTKLASKARLILTNDLEQFEATYPDLKDVQVYPWDSGKLANKGERLVLSYGDHTSTCEVRYDDTSPWPENADGLGHSLERVDNEIDQEASSWRASNKKGGSPGR